VTRKRGIADESPSSLGGWLFADLFLLLIVVGFSAFTSNGDDRRPIVTTEAATAITTESAVLNGSVGPKRQRTTVVFDWGRDPTLRDSRQIKASNSPVSGAEVNTPFFVNLEGLENRTTYYFRAVAANESGKSVGKILSFTTDGGRPCDPDGAKFLKEPFIERFTMDSIDELVPMLQRWTDSKELTEPKVAVAQISGWTLNPSKSEGKSRAEKLYYNHIKKMDSEREFFYEDTALSAWQKSSLKQGWYEVVLYFVDLVERCDS
jgi:hypothetical protein